VGEKFETKGEEPRRSKTFIDWKGVVTSASRNAIPEDSFSNLENMIPLGAANLHTINNISAVLHDFTTVIIYWAQYVNINLTDYLICFSTAGGVYAYNIGTSGVVTVGTGLSGSGSRCAQWNNSQLLIIDSTGYYNWPGTGSMALITGTGVPTSGTDIAVAFNRVWIAQARGLIFGGVDPTSGYTAAFFTVANGAGTVGLIDPTLRSSITRIFYQNSYLYVIGSTCINAISDLYVPTGANPPTPLFTNTNLQAIIGSNMPGSFFPMNRGLMFANGYGAWGLYGVQAQQISEDIDGTWQYINPATALSGGAAVIANKICSCFLVPRLNDPIFGSNTVVAINFDKKWFFANYSAVGAITFLAGVIVSNKPALFGFIGNKLYQLFADPTTGPATVAQTALWPMEDNLADKEIIRAGFEATVLNATGTFSMTCDTTNMQYQAVNLTAGGAVQWVNNLGNVVQWQNNALAPVSWFSGQYLLYNGSAPGTYGKYVGQTVTSSGAIYQLSAFDMDYKLRARWN
jgi:hypothetical protein